jgi:hypothetical protein
MLNMFARAAIANDRPPRIIGVEATNVSAIARRPPNAPSSNAK